MKTFATCLIAVLVVAVLSSAIEACPSCKDTIANTPGSGDPSAPSLGMPAGFNISIYLMLSAFVGVLGFVGFTLYRGVRSTPSSP